MQLIGFIDYTNVTHFFYSSSFLFQMMETESSILNVDQERASLSNRFINFVKNAMKTAKLTTAVPLSPDTKDDDKRGAIRQEDTDNDDPDISELLTSPKDWKSDSDMFSNLKLLLFPCEEYEYCGRKYQQNDNHTLNEAAKSLEKFVFSHNGELGDRDRSFEDSDKSCVFPRSLGDSGSENDSTEDLCSPGQCPACHIEDCKLSFEEYFDFSDDDTESNES